MISARQWSAVALRRPFLSTLHSVRVAPRVTIRASSLSAIHRGLRGSEKAQYGEVRERPAPRERPIPGQRSLGRDSALTAKALGGAASARQQGKLRKKLRRRDEKKEVEEEEEPGRRTRRKRFLDVDSKFGKKSMVYQLKHGSLKETADKLPLPEPVRARPFRSMDRERRTRRDEPSERPRLDSATFQSKMDEPESYPRSNTREHRPKRRVDQALEELEEEPGPRSFRPKSHERRPRRDETRQFRPRTEERESRPRSDDREFRPRSDDRGSRSRPDEREHRPRSDNREFRPRSDDREFRPRSDARESRPRRDFDDNSEDARPTMLGRRRIMMPMNVKYTTAASQFLYGKSVVRAALEQGRRKLYTLYIYGGENRKDIKDNTTMTRLAEKRGVPITIVPTDEQRIMDKMSMGRPHNGFVLETSPLPQLPIKSLGRLEETPSRMGFHVELDRQTKEEESINGEETFVPRANDLNPKPFVLLLNEILDPGNLGAALRTASYLGVDAVGITNRGSSTLTPVVLKSAAGAVEEITIFTVDSPLKFIEDSKKAGWKTYAAVPPPERKLAKKHGGKFISMDTVEQDTPLADYPCILVLGNEGHGLPKPLKVASDYELSVPRFVQSSCVDSLNVSVAAALLCHAFVKEPVAQKVDRNDAITTSEEDVMWDEEVDEEDIYEENEADEGDEVVESYEEESHESIEETPDENSRQDETQQEEIREETVEETLEEEKADEKKPEGDRV